MRHYGEAAPPSPPPSANPAATAAAAAAASTAAPAPRNSDWATLSRLLPYLWQYKWRVIVAIVFMVGAKVANVGVPVLLKNLIDAMDIKPGNPAAVLVVPVGLLVAYGLLRLSTHAVDIGPQAAAVAAHAVVGQMPLQVTPGVVHHGLAATWAQLSQSLSDFLELAGHTAALQHSMGSGLAFMQFSIHHRSRSNFWIEFAIKRQPLSQVL